MYDQKNILPILMSTCITGHMHKIHAIKCVEALIALIELNLCVHLHVCSPWLAVGADTRPSYLHSKLGKNASSRECYRRVTNFKSEHKRGDLRSSIMD